MNRIEEELQHPFFTEFSARQDEVILNDAQKIILDEIKWLSKLSLLITNGDTLKTNFVFDVIKNGAFNDLSEELKSQCEYYLPPSLQTKESSFHQYISNNKISVEERIALVLLLDFELNNEKSRFFPSPDFKKTLDYDPTNQFAQATIKSWAWLSNYDEPDKLLELINKLHTRQYLAFDNGVIKITGSKNTFSILNSCLDLNEKYARHFISNIPLDKVS